MKMRETSRVVDKKLQVNHKCKARPFYALYFVALDVSCILAPEFVLLLLNVLKRVKYWKKS